MKSKNLILGTILLILMGCEGNKSDSLITVDVTADYPKKELILQDFIDVEYVLLETTDEFIVKGKIADVGKDILVLTNVRQGEILIFDRSTGKGLKKINRRGQGPEEYILPFNVHLNKEEDEIHITISGNGFLYNMVRIIAGTLIQVGKGKYEPKYIRQMLEAGDRTQAGQTAPPQGLTLMKIEYLDEER